MAWQGRVRLGEAWRGLARLGEAGQGMAKRDNEAGEASPPRIFVLYATGIT